MKGNVGKYQSGREVFAEYIPNYRPAESSRETSGSWAKSGADETVNSLLSELRQHLAKIKPKRDRQSR